ncbi:MAG TPA: AI-2E family transporter [Solirubrobacteraceae bacterium]|nr:AI-2E family transporter [Solirubrobacteraceae bacterium]
MARGTPSTATIARVFATLAALSGLLYVAYLVRTTIELILIGAFLAVAMAPAVNFFVRRRVPKVLAIILVYLLVLTSVVGVGLLIVPPVVTQVQSLSNNIPGYLNKLQRSKAFRKYDRKYHITDKLNQAAKNLPAKLASASGALASVTVGAFSAIVQLVTVLAIAFYLLLDGERIVTFILSRARPARAKHLRVIADRVGAAVTGYVAGNILISVICGTVTYVTLALLGVPFAVPLSILMAFTDLIPLVGFVIGGFAIALVTLFTHFPTATIVWAVVFVLYQSAEAYLLQPLIYNRTTEVPGLTVLIAILIGAALLGVLGALLAIPIAAAIQIIVREVWAMRAEEAPLGALPATPPAPP